MNIIRGIFLSLLISCASSPPLQTSSTEFEDPVYDYYGICTNVADLWCQKNQDCGRESYWPCTDRFETQVCSRLQGIRNVSLLVTDCMEWLANGMTCYVLFDPNYQLPAACANQFITGDPQ